jgi:cytochrome c oxidase subunit 4
MTDHYESHLRTYGAVFLALCVFTVMSIMADVLHFANHNVTVAIVLAVAVAKALCVMMFFMHLKFERAWKYLLLAPTLILASAIPFALMPDVGMHYYTPDNPQLHEYETRNVEKGHGDEHHPPAEHH